MTLGSVKMKFQQSASFCHVGIVLVKARAGNVDVVVTEMIQCWSGNVADMLSVALKMTFWCN